MVVRAREFGTGAWPKGPNLPEEKCGNFNAIASLKEKSAPVWNALRKIQAEFGCPK